MLELNLQQRFRTPSLIMRAPPLRGAHLLRPFSYAFLLLIFVTQNAHACIWQDSAHPFWPSNKIEVCFLSQEEHLTSDPLLVKAYNDTRQKIQRVLNQQFNLRFLPTSDANIPQKVQESANSIFRFQAAKGDGLVFHLPEDKERALKYIESQNPGVEMTKAPGAEAKKDNLKAQIQRCEELSIRECRLHSLSSNGTSYLLESPHRLMTALHVVQPLIDNFSRPRGHVDLCEHEGPGSKVKDCDLIHNQQRLIDDMNKNLRIRAFVMRTGKILIHPDDGEFKIVKWLAENLKYNDSYMPHEDGVALEFHKKDGTVLNLSEILGAAPLKLAQQAPTVDTENVYLVGFPAATDRLTEKDMGYGNSDGIHQFVSIGQRFSLQNFQVIEDELSLKFSEDLSMGHIYTRADAIGGNSGGPFLNSQGQVTGSIKGVVGVPNDRNPGYYVYQYSAPATWGPSQLSLKALLP